MPPHEEGVAYSFVFHELNKEKLLFSFLASLTGTDSGIIDEVIQPWKKETEDKIIKEAQEAFTVLENYTVSARPI